MIDQSHIDLLSLIGGRLKKVVSKGQNGAVYHGPCPECGGEDRFTVEPDTGNGGRWACRQCHPKWGDALAWIAHRENLRLDDPADLVTAAEKLNIKLPRHQHTDNATIQPVECTKREYTDLADYGKAHGIGAHVLEFWHWRQTTHKGRKALVFPTKSGERFRFLDGKKPHYISTVGYQACWYGMSEYLIQQVCAEKRLIICNGEISTIVGQHYNLPAIAMTGGEKTAIPTNLLDELKGKFADVDELQVIVAMDCDNAGHKSATGIQAQLIDNRFYACAVDLKLGTGGDLADFCKLYQDDSLKRLLELPQLPQLIEPSAQKWIIDSDSAMLGLPDTEWLVAGELPARGLTMLYGASGTYKSFVMLDKSLKLADEGTVCMYIAAEDEYGYKPRLQAWYKHYKKQPSGRLYFVRGAVNLFDPNETLEFSRLADAYKPKMIVVDTLGMSTGTAEENSARDMKVIVDGCKGIANALNCLVVVVHHTNAGGKQERGSKFLRNACDTIIRISHGDDCIVVESQKSKSTSKFKPYALKEVVIDLGYENNLGEPVSSLVLLLSEMVVRPEGLTDKQRAVLEVIAVQPEASPTEIADATEIDRQVIYDVLKRLEKKGLTTTQGKARQITDKGKVSLEAEDSSDSSDSGLESRELENRVSGKSADSSLNRLNLNTQTEQPTLIEDDLTNRKRNHYTDGTGKHD